MESSLIKLSIFFNGKGLLLLLSILFLSIFSPLIIYFLRWSKPAIDKLKPFFIVINIFVFCSSLSLLTLHLSNKTKDRFVLGIREDNLFYLNEIDENNRKIIIYEYLSQEPNISTISKFVAQVSVLLSSKPLYSSYLEQILEKKVSETEILKRDLVFKIATTNLDKINLKVLDEILSDNLNIDEINKKLNTLQTISINSLTLREAKKATLKKSIANLISSAVLSTNNVIIDELIDSCIEKVSDIRTKSVKKITPYGLSLYLSINTPKLNFINTNYINSDIETIYYISEEEMKNIEHQLVEYHKKLTNFGQRHNDIYKIKYKSSSDSSWVEIFIKALKKAI